MKEELEYPDFFGDTPIFSGYEIDRPKKEELIIVDQILTAISEDCKVEVKAYIQ